MLNDAELLQRYVNERSGDDFAELVRRHVDFVYSAALRQVNGDAHLAQDVVQMVFVDLARKAPRLLGHRVLSGWLFVSTRFAAAKAVRTEQRRRMREREAQLMETNLPERNEAGDWERVRPVLDEALAELGETDRAAILLRFFEGRGFAEVGERLELSENSARMRVERALDKLHPLLARRGVTSTSGALAAALAGQAVTAAPAGLAASVTGAALAGAAAGGGGVAAATFMSMTKLQIGLAGAVALTGVAGVMSQQRAAEALEREAATVAVDDGRAEALRAENRQLALSEDELKRLREDEAAAQQLRDEAAVLQRQVDERTRAAEAALVAKRNAEKAAAAARVAVAVKRASDHPTLDMLPRLSATRPPVYPAEMFRAGVSGEVTVAFVVDADGEVHDATAVQSSHREFEAAAIEAVAAWKFEPGIKSQRPVNTRMVQSIVFSYPNKDGRAEGLRAGRSTDGFWPQ